MSLTSYRAAPPRETFFHRPAKCGCFYHPLGPGSKLRFVRDAAATTGALRSPKSHGGYEPDELRGPLRLAALGTSPVNGGRRCSTPRNREADIGYSSATVHPRDGDFSYPQASGSASISTAIS